MAASSPLNGSGPQLIWLEAWGVASTATQTQWYYEVRYYGLGYGSWGGGPFYWSLTGFAESGVIGWSIPQSQAFDEYMVLGSGYFWKTHVGGYLAPGNLIATIDTNHAAIGDGSVSVLLTPPMLGSRPDAPTPYPDLAGSVDMETIDSMRYRFQDGANNGAPITSRAIQYSTSPDFTTGTSAWIAVDSSGTYVLTGATPGTDYYFRSRIQNSAGLSDNSVVSQGTTLAGIFVSDGTAWVPTGPRVSDGSAWVPLMPKISNGTVWSDPIDV